MAVDQQPEDIAYPSGQLPAKRRAAETLLAEDEADESSCASLLPPSPRKGSDYVINIDNKSEDGEADGSGCVTPLPPDSYSNHYDILNSFVNISHHPNFGILIKEISMYCH